jgi:hypothetical protein
MTICLDAMVEGQLVALHMASCDSFLIDLNLRLPFCQGHSQIVLLRWPMVHLDATLPCQDLPASLIQSMMK